MGGYRDEKEWKKCARAVFFSPPPKGLCVWSEPPCFPSSPSQDAHALVC